jgi:photosystem II stability/assembly factor-like uncharacterized protein
VLYVDERTGANALAMDPSNPRVLYAGMWRAERKPWTMLSGNEDGGLFRSADGGDTWKKLEGGLPGGLLGKIDVAISPANPDRVWTLIEASGERGGLYRSDDSGQTWNRVNGDAKLLQRPWYYIHVFADPGDENTVYVLNVDFWKSVDGGQTFAHEIEVRHGDNHDLWINPADPKLMVSGNDGGASVSLDGGKTWSWQMNQPTAEIYRLFVDDQWPYRIYGSQQDNSTISVPSRGAARWDRTPPEWYSVGGCESGHIAIDPRNPDVVYAGCYGGSISRVDRGTGESRQILAYPQLQLGQAARDLKYRFQWNAPIRLSPHDPDVLYHAAQVVLRSEDEGQSWQAISPDLTTDDAETQDYAGGPINHDNTGVEVYNTVFAFEESPHVAGLLWAGSDDGRVHLSRNAGATWTEITPPGMPEGGTVNAVELSPHDPGRAFIAVYRYRENDFRPWIFRTDDYGASWELLTSGTNGIPATHFTRAVREDPARRGLLYAGTEFGLYVSFDDGGHWQSLQADLPVSPITDLRVHRNDLVVSTQGRGFWVLDDLTPLHQLSAEVRQAQAWLFEPRPAWRGLGSAEVNYYFAELPEGEVRLEIADAQGELILSITGEPGGEASRPPSGSAAFFGGDGPARLAVKKGMNRFEWNLRGEAPERPEGLVHWGRAAGRPAIPGAYTLTLSAGDWSQRQTLEVGISPNLRTTLAEFQAQDELLKEIGAELEQAFDGLTRARELREQVKDVKARFDKAGIDDEAVSAAAEALTGKLSLLEEELTQVKSRSSQDPINFPPQIDNQIVTLYAYVAGFDYQPTAGAHQRLADLRPELQAILARLDAIVAEDVGAFNELVASKALAPVVVPKRE